MADFPTIPSETLLVSFVQAMVATRFDYRRAVTELEVPTFSGTWAAGGATPPAAPRDNYPGLIDIEATPGFDWFDEIHIVPRSTQQLGVVVANVTVLFEVFNAYRVPVSLNTFVNGLTPGVTVPDLPALPYVLAPFASLLDPTSTRLAPVRIEALVARDGIPLFDGSLDFIFSTGDTVSLQLAGTRVSLIPVRYEAEFDERWTFPTDDGLEAVDGTSQLVALSANPVQLFVFLFRLDGTDRQRMQALLFGAQSQLLALPLWHEEVRTTAPAAATAVVVAVTSTTGADFRVGGLAVLFDSAGKFDVLVVSSVATNSIGFATTPLINTYAAAGVTVAPVRLGAIVNDVSAARYLVRLEDFRVVFEVSDNDTGMFAPSVVGWSSYDSRVLLDDCNVVTTRTVPQKFTKRVTILDAGTGRIESFDNWRTNRREHVKGFTARGRAGYRQLKQLLLALRGPQVSFYLPTFAEDLTASQPLFTGTSALDIVHQGYTKFVQSRGTKALFRITFTDGTSLVRTVTSAAELSATEERLTIDPVWPADRPLAEIVRIEFLERSRFATKSFTFGHDGTGRVTLAAPVKTLNA